MIQAPELIGAWFCDLPPGTTKGMSMLKRLCAAIGLAAIAISLSHLSLYGA